MRGRASTVRSYQTESRGKFCSLVRSVYSQSAETAESRQFRWIGAVVNELPPINIPVLGGSVKATIGALFVEEADSENGSKPLAKIPNFLPIRRSSPPELS